MSNQTILWSMLVVPWVTLLLMKKEDLKRYAPVGLFSALTSVLMVEVLGTLNIVNTRETVFPLSHTVTYVLGYNPVASMWLFRFFYKRFWVYLSVITVLNLVYSFLMVTWLNARGILESSPANNPTAFLLTSVHGILLYVYQMWQEDALVPALKKTFFTVFQPAAAKPAIRDDKER